MKKRSQKKDPPIDYLKGVILERKLVKHLTYEEIAKEINVNQDYLRKLVSTKNTEDWSSEIREAICKTLGIELSTIISKISRDNSMKNE